MNHCHTCNMTMAYRAMPNHRAAHKRRGERCVISTKEGTFEWDYREEQQ